MAEASCKNLIREVERGDAFGVRFELARGADPDTRDASGACLLHRAVARAPISVIKALIEGGATIDIGDRQGDTPLHHAVREERIEVIDALVAAGADPNRANHAGQRPVDLGSMRARRHLLPDVFDITGSQPSAR